jgi:hypothetical protein
MIIIAAAINKMYLVKLKCLSLCLTGIIICALQVLINIIFSVFRYNQYFNHFFSYYPNLS